MPYDDETLEELLANGHLSGASYDRIEERVFAEAAPKPRVLRARFWWAAAAACGIGAVLLLPGRFEPPSAGSGFTEKGAPTIGAGAVELACSSDGRTCRPGDTLMFLVNSAAIAGYVSATALRLDPPSQERLRLFPTESGEAPYVAAGEGMVVASQGIRLGPNLPAGRYRVDVWFSAAKPAPSAAPPPAEGVVEVELRIEQ